MSRSTYAIRDLAFLATLLCETFFFLTEVGSTADDFSGEIGRFTLHETIKSTNTLKMITLDLSIWAKFGVILFKTSAVALIIK
jgi:hypothetical protein